MHHKAFILESAAAATGNRTAVVLGSGMLLDVPLAELSQRFEQVILVDIVHLPWVKRQGKRYPNVRFQELDVTGVCKALFDQVEQVRLGQGATLKLPQILPKSLAQSLGVTSIDFLASVNLLSQLPIVPCAYIEKHCLAYYEADRVAFSRAMINNHLLWLKSCAEQVCLITDLDRVICDKGGMIVEREETLLSMELPTPVSQWEWVIAPHPELERNLDLMHSVGAFLLVQ